MFDFLKQKIAIFLTRIGQKMLILHDNLEFFMAREKLPLKKGNFWSTLEPMVTFFGLKNYTSP